MLMRYYTNLKNRNFPEEPYHVFNYYTIQTFKRDALKIYLEKKGISSAIYYPLSLHLQPVYKSMGFAKGDFPNSEWLQEHVLSLPMYPELTKEQIDIISDEVIKFEKIACDS
jgi:dTDP-4-amino-4,6-dideoxygalactose transaminase